LLPAEIGVVDGIGVPGDGALDAIDIPGGGAIPVPVPGSAQAVKPWLGTVKTQKPHHSYWEQMAYTSCCLLFTPPVVASLEKDLRPIPPNLC
jgi:hypothetical protein